MIQKRDNNPIVALTTMIRGDRQARLIGNLTLCLSDCHLTYLVSFWEAQATCTCAPAYIQTHIFTHTHVSLGYEGVRAEGVCLAVKLEILARNSVVLGVGAKGVMAGGGYAGSLSACWKGGEGKRETVWREPNRV